MKKIILESLVVPLSGLLVIVSTAVVYANPDLRALVKQYLFPEKTGLLCLPPEIVGGSISLEIGSLIVSTNNAYWHHFPEETGIYILDPNSKEADSWRWLYMRQIACRLYEREKVGLESSQTEIEQSLKLIKKTRSEFERKRPRLLWGKGSQSDNVA